MKSKVNKKDVYQVVTDKIIALLDAGTVPWHKPWKSGGFGNGDHKNVISKKEYRGINPWLLQISVEENGFVSPYWMTFRQAKMLGGNVMKGEKSTMVVFWKFFEKEEKVFDPDTKKWITKVDEHGRPMMRSIPMLRHYNVFNYQQTEGIDPKRLPPDVMPKDEGKKKFNSIKACERIVAEMQNRPEIKHSTSPRAYYSPSLDRVHMPLKEMFDVPAEYYSVIFHELGHSTLHESRLDRKAQKIAAFGDEDYSKEELVAEMCAAMLCGICRISPKVVENQAAYIRSWSKELKDDRKMVVIAASQAQKAADYIQNKI